ncbi:uncharacterized protein BT62DRAFT_932550 [Guyanagaster necrorhizus]|uniref:MYND-type domain-containing protein n=1 Tax=Guyanagaster necrorhizus TaxID=856835 RepID=A0A9P7VT39_9AGAR|nr:uncharacterized protein BT62DRAFT_932550 [Guyanagaster necrorhizus MCA 3950]KAG7446185.1 hypothetical protein BT62DRAFT_932550 [Guyanagaster necrorhizus MCA 3950]
MNPTCLGAYYCSKAHIVQDWPAHKTYCKRVSDAGTNIFDAILFGVNETKPRLIKLPWYGRWHNLDMEPWFKGRDSFIRTYYVQTFGANGPVLHHTLAVCFDDNFMINGSQINRCIQNVTFGNAGHPWAGNILALRVEGFRSDWYSDTVMEEDLAPLARYFEDSYRK